MGIAHNVGSTITSYWSESGSAPFLDLYILINRKSNWLIFRVCTATWRKIESYCESAIDFMQNIFQKTDNTWEL